MGGEWETEITSAANSTHDLGNGHKVRFWRISLSDWPIGAVELHNNQVGEPCGCSLPFRDAPEAWRRQADGSLHPGWQVVDYVPLTLIPSVVCTRCGAHGFIQKGKWVAA